MISKLSPKEGVIFLSIDVPAVILIVSLSPSYEIKHSELRRYGVIETSNLLSSS